jgi:hypothetical protein
MNRRTSTGLCSVTVFVIIISAQVPAIANPSVKAIAVTFAALTGWAVTHPGQVPSGGGSYTFNAGAFDRVDRVAQTWNLGFERRWGGFAVWRLKPFAGIDVTGRRSLYYFGGLRLDLRFASHFDIEPNFAVAHYLHGGGKELGSPIEFRSGLNMGWRFTDGKRIGIAYHHMSHWILLNSSNPGTEILALTFSMPLR